MIALYIIFAMALLQGIISLIDGIRSARHIRTFRPGSNRRPEVVVFCPCKGTDAQFLENIQSILDQDYPSLTPIFIVESVNDPAYSALESLGVRVLVAGRSTSRGQKVHNLIHAVEHVPDAAEVFVFCDADARFPRHWI